MGVLYAHTMGLSSKQNHRAEARLWEAASAVAVRQCSSDQFQPGLSSVMVAPRCLPQKVLVTEEKLRL